MSGRDEMGDVVGMAATTVGHAGPGPILVVDDERGVRSVFARALHQAGYDVLQAADGLEALAILDQQAVSLILLDRTMPRLDGAGVIRAVRARDATRMLPIILITALADPEDRVSGLEAGADDYLPKPVVLDELVARVRAQLRGHDAWQQAIEQTADERRRLTAAVSRVRLDGAPERGARALVAELVPALGLDSLAIVAFMADGRAIPLGLHGSWPELGRPGLAIEAGLAARLRARGAEGPWMQHWSSVPEDGRPAAGRDVAAIPLAGRDGPLGVALFGDRPQEQGSGLAGRMPILLEAAGLVTALLRPALEADADRRGAYSSLAAVIAQHAFLPYFQPVVSLADRAVAGYEALTRFSDGTAPELGFAEAARLGLGPALELATLQAAAAAAVSLPPDAFLALNVSPSLVVESPGLGAALARATRPIVLELTEHAQVADYPTLRAALGRLDPPVRTAVDDAGSGYASLRHILALRPDFVKLDLGWIRGIEVDAARQALIAGLVHFAATVGCELIAEGIETESECRTIADLGVRYGQGYLLGRPMPAPAAAGGDGVQP